MDMDTNKSQPKYIDRLRERARFIGNTLCVGLDPVLDKIPTRGETPADKIRRFYEAMLSGMAKRKLLPCAVKPNMAYYESLDLECLGAMQAIMRDFQGEGVLVILDAKRGDIASSSTGYAKMAFNVYPSDAATVNPYMGLDSVQPFLEFGARGVYVLVRTSNPSARDFQDLLVKTEEGFVPLYRVVASRLLKWNNGNIGAVVGATAPAELEWLLSFWKGQGQEIPTLIPGVAVGGVSGGQTGSLSEVVKAIRNSGADLHCHLINSSSGINYAYEKYSELKPAEASVKALESMLEEMARA